MLRLRQVLLAAAVLLLLVGGVSMALLPFGDGSARCGAPLFGAEPAVDGFSDGASRDTIALPGRCGDEGVRRLVYATGLFVVGLTAAIVIAVRWDRSARHEDVPHPVRTGD